MKYIVNLEHTVKRTVIIDAVDDKEADKKLQNGEIEKEWKRIESDGSYEDWSYIDYVTVDSEKEIITCANDLAKLYGCEDENGLERALFKYTNCGMCANWDEEKIVLIGYVEGCDAPHPCQTLFFPFTVEKFREVREELEELADEMWQEWNEED